MSNGIELMYLNNNAKSVVFRKLRKVMKHYDFLISIYKGT